MLNHGQHSQTLSLLVSCFFEHLFHFCFSHQKMLIQLLALVRYVTMVCLTSESQMMAMIISGATYFLA